jgi:hypothetical protein
MQIEEEKPTNAPNTDSEAKPNKWEIAPSGRKVIEVKDALYRNAVISGRFLVALGEKTEGRNKDGHKTIEVECTWYGWQPKKSSIRLTLINEEIVLNGNEIIDVIKNIGK